MCFGVFIEGFCYLVFDILESWSDCFFCFINMLNFGDVFVVVMIVVFGWNSEEGVCMVVEFCCYGIIVKVLNYNVCYLVDVVVVVY